MLIHRRKGKSTSICWCGVLAVWKPDGGWTERAVRTSVYNCEKCKKAIGWQRQLFGKRITTRKKELANAKVT